MKRVSKKSTPAPSRLRVNKPLEDDDDDEESSDRYTYARGVFRRPVFPDQLCQGTWAYTHTAKAECGAGVLRESEDKSLEDGGLSLDRGVPLSFLRYIRVESPRTIVTFDLWSRPVREHGTRF